MKRFFTALFLTLIVVVGYAAAPNITSVTIPAGNYKIGSVITLTIFSDGTGYTLGASTVNGQAVTGFVDLGNNNYTVNYTVVGGDVDRASVGAIPISINLKNGVPNTTYTTAPTSGGTVTIYANAPTISSITIPNVAMKVGSAVTATITVGDDGGQTYTLSATTIRGVTLGSF